MNLFYKLDKNKNVIPATMEESNDFLKNKKGIVKQEVILDKFVSTVFLPIDHDFSGKGIPIVFETMIKDKNSCFWLNYQERYSTWQEAEEGHARAIQWVKDGCKEECL
jgi:hypothetical protein